MNRRAQAWHEAWAREVYRVLKASVDSCVTDPPYGLEFMGKEWDRLGGDVRTDGDARTDKRGIVNPKDWGGVQDSSNGGDVVIRVYVAGPITKGDRPANIRAGILAGEQLRAAGFVPFVPHLTELWATVIGGGQLEDWLPYDLAWLDVCDAVVRLPGESVGADAEVAHALERGIPVYLSVEEFLADHAGGGE